MTAPVSRWRAGTECVQAGDDAHGRELLFDSALSLVSAGEVVRRLGSQGLEAGRCRQGRDGGLGATAPAEFFMPACLNQPPSLAPEVPSVTMECRRGRCSTMCRCQCQDSHGSAGFEWR